MDVETYRAVESWKAELDGVFTIADLKVALDEDAPATLYRALSELTRSGTLIKVKRGIYASPEASLATISSRIEPNRSPISPPGPCSPGQP